jgi:hypothetical protein
MVHPSPINTRWKEATKANKSPFDSPGTKKAWQQTKDRMVTKALTDLRVMVGKNDE